jgi:hypothetical protein
MAAGWLGRRPERKRVADTATVNAPTPIGRVPDLLEKR